MFKRAVHPGEVLKDEREGMGLQAAARIVQFIQDC